MIEFLMNIGLLVLASSSRRNNEKRKAQCERLQKEVEEKDAQVAELTERVEDITSHLQHALREKEKEWSGRMSAWQEETLKVGSVLRGEFRKLEEELGHLKQFDLGLEIKTVKELDDLRFSLPQKVSVREAQKLELIRAEN
ncbi:unnamed protein product [Agarophyton chilense]